MIDLRRARGFLSSLGELFETRDLEGDRRRMERAESAMRRVTTDPMRKIEDDLGLDTYNYGDIHDGYATEAQNSRPVSRSQEIREYEDAEASIDKRLKSAANG